jgi:hypothetical protein
MNLAADMVKAWDGLGADSGVADRKGDGEGWQRLAWQIHLGVRGKARGEMRLGMDRLDPQQLTFHYTHTMKLMFT